MFFIRFIFRIVLVGAVGVLAAALTMNAYLHWYAHSREFTLQTAPTADAVIIPGASVYPGGILSPLLKERADTALALYNEGRVSRILVSGDSVSANHDEVEPIHAYLRGAGVPEEAILLDPRGVDTYSTMYRARELFAIQSAIIATQGFHLPRALYLAGSLGIDVSGVRSGTSTAAPHDVFREFFADEKAVLNIAFGRTVPLD
jgi:SanA protein